MPTVLPILIGNNKGLTILHSIIKTTQPTLIAIHPSLAIRTVALRVPFSGDDALSLTFGVRAVARVAGARARCPEPTLVADTSSYLK